jgi:hypothetical protein
VFLRGTLPAIFAEQVALLARLFRFIANSFTIAQSSVGSDLDGGTISI